MKILSVILALLIMILSGMPCPSDEICSCGDMTEQSADKDMDEDCTDACCSPFFSCDTCYGFIPIIAVAVKKIPASTVKFITVGKSDKLSEYIVPILRPPIY